MTEPAPRPPANIGDGDRPYRGRRLTWAEFREIVPPAENDNHPVGDAKEKPVRL